jgi:hypothetical protein
MAYIHPENQKLLWNTIQKTPIFNNLGSRQTQWFKSVIQHFYEEYPNAKVIKTKDELQTINRATVSFMVNSLKEMFQPKQTATPSSETNYGNTLLPSTTGSNERVSYYNDQFNNRQKEYESMNAKPLPPTNSIVDEKISDEAITNMDELIRQQIEQRELEMKMYGQGPIVQQPKKLNINEEIPKNSVENLIVYNDENKEKNEKNENKEKSKKSVSWNTEENEFEELKKMVFDLMETIQTMKQRIDEITHINPNTNVNQNTIE